MAYIVLVVSQGDKRGITWWKTRAVLRQSIKSLVDELAEGKLFLLTDLNNATYSAAPDNPTYQDRPYKQFATAYDNDGDFVLKTVFIGEENESIRYAFDTEHPYSPSITFPRHLPHFDEYIFLKVSLTKEELIERLNPSVDLANQEATAKTMRKNTRQVMQSVKEVIYHQVQNQELLNRLGYSPSPKEGVFTIKPPEPSRFVNKENKYDIFIDWQPEIASKTTRFHSKDENDDKASNQDDNSTYKPALDELIQLCKDYEARLKERLEYNAPSDQQKTLDRRVALTHLIDSVKDRAAWSNSKTRQAFNKFEVAFEKFSKKYLQDKPDAADKEFWRKMKAAFSLGIYALIRGYRVGSLFHFYKSRKEILKEKVHDIENKVKPR